MSDKKKSGTPQKGKVTLLIATRKGGFMLHSNRRREKWTLQGPILLGSIINHMHLDPRDGKTILLAASTGHLGPTIFRSTDRGETWSEASKPPAFPKATKGKKGETIRYTFVLAPGHPSEPGIWYAGTSPAAIFRSEDGGDTWHGVAGFNKNPLRRTWIGPKEFTPPGGGGLHSIQIDPRDPNHIYIGLSLGGVFETTDQGATWQPLNSGCQADFLPDPDADFGHDPHALRLHPADADVLYQQNHFGVYRMNRPNGIWERIGVTMPEPVGDIGFPILLHPRNPDQVWVFPMDGTDVWPRTSPGGEPAVYTTRNAGKSWKRMRKGLPPAHGYFTVKRQALTADLEDSLGIYFGTTGGQIWGSTNEGRRWYRLADFLPEILAIEAVTFQQ